MEAEAASPASSSEGVSSSEAFVIRVENLWHLYGGEEAQHSQGESPLSLALRAALDEASLTSKEKPDSPRKKARPSPALEGVSFAVPRGARVLVVGSNGAGKSTLLSILGGQTMIQRGKACVLNRDAFKDVTLASEVACLNNWWSGDFTMDVFMRDILNSALKRHSEKHPPRHSPAETSFNEDSSGLSRNALLCGCPPGFHCERWRAELLLQLLDVSLDWKINKRSAGERRRCQMVAALMQPRSLYILDEAVGELDVLSRGLLCRFLLKESLARNSTVLYSTHVFDGLANWPTHVLYLHRGSVGRFLPVQEIPEIKQAPGDSSAGDQRLLSAVRGWLKAEPQNQARQKAAQRLEEAFEK